MSASSTSVTVDMKPKALSTRNMSTYAMEVSAAFTARNMNMIFVMPSKEAFMSSSRAGYATKYAARTSREVRSSWLRRLSSPI